MGDSFAKKENIKKRVKKKEDKAKKTEERRSRNDKGKTLEDMIVYVDEFGNFTSAPPDASSRREIDPEEILLGAAPIAKEDPEWKGTVAFFSEKGYGFITSENSRDKIFVHVNDLAEPVKEKDKVRFEVERRERGLVAINVKKIGS